MRVTIKDVAKLAGVAPSTVTRVIQNKSTISDETKKRVREAMVELDYHPNLNARSLVSQSSQVIALVLPIDSDVFYQNPFFPTVLRGITQIASDNDYAIQICTGQNEERRLDNLQTTHLRKSCRWFDFPYSNPNDPLVEFAIKDKFPFLILGKAASPFVSLVDNDNIKAAFDATDYFIQHYEGYKEALQKAGIPLDEKLVHFSFGFMLEDNSYQMMESLPLAELDAIMTTDILVAEGVRQYLLEHQLTIPIISFDSIKPRLDIEAYIDINAVELGRESVRTILQIIKDHKEGKTVCYRQLIDHTITKL